VFVAGLAILCASFVLLWACDAVQSDISQSLALALVALVAVLPEYAVDMYFTWQAGKHPEAGYAGYAIANMTGANRLLIGVGWAMICGISWLRYRRPVALDPSLRTELLFLGMATAYAFVIPLKGTLAWYDCIVFAGLYAWYMVLASRKPHGEAEPEGPAAAIMRLPVLQRRTATGILFVIAAGAILANAEPFCEGLIQSGKLFRINEFILVQWLAPVASEAPEFIVALIFAWRGRADLAIASLLSAKLNQWTLLVGMIPGVYAVAHGTLEHPLPMAAFQMQEVLLTAAQSLLGLVVLASLRFRIGEALLLFLLFAGQFAAPSAVAHGTFSFFGMPPEFMHPIFTVFYLFAAAAMFLHEPGNIARLWRGLEVYPVSAGDVSPRVVKSEQCESCRWRLAAVEAERASVGPRQ
jgi:cation:H+ antiporter